MWRVLLYLVLFGIAAAGAIWLADHPETISLTWAGRQYSVSLAVGIVGIMAIAMLLSLLWAVLRFVAGLPRNVGRRSRERRHERGLRALSRGIVAVGAGDLTAARRYASEAERLVGHEPLALLLKAQSAQAAGDRAAAESAFRRMIDQPETRVLGLRGLYVEARRRGDADAAREHAAEAARIAPAAAWANDAVLDAQSAAGDWAAATRNVERRTSLGLIDRATSHRQRAVLRTAEALRLDADGRIDPALDAALDGVRLAPDLVPAATLAGRLLAGKGDLKKAARIIEAAWRQSPHPDLAAAYLNLRAGDSATDRLRRAETLARLSSWAPESRIAIARAAIDARQPDRARSVIAPLLAERPTTRICLLMAELEGTDGRAGRAREWLARAARAPRDASWIADGVVSETWAPVSPVSGRLDAFIWAAPPEVLGAPIPHDLFADEPEPEPVASLAPPEPEPGPSSGLDLVGEAARERPGLDQVADISPEARATTAAEPVAPAEVTPPPQDAGRPVGPNGAERLGRTPSAPRDPEPVVFPVPHAPDDPGPDGRDASRQALFRRRG